MADGVQKKRGRPPLSPEIKAERASRKGILANAYHKQTGYAAQARYRTAHPEKYRNYREIAKGKTYEPKLRIPIEKKEALTQLLDREHMSLTHMFVSLVLEKYSVDLSYEPDADNK